MSIVRPPDDSTYIWRAAAAEEFARYYLDEGGGGAARARAAQVCTLIHAVLERSGSAAACLHVAEIGCGDGTGCRLWAEGGHVVHGLDRNRALVTLARKRARLAGHDTAFEVADPAALPWPSRSMDVCIAHGLPEQTADLRAAVRELVRVLKPGGVLYLSTRNAIDSAPRAADRGPRARTLASGWYSYYRLREHLRRHGLQTRDRLDLAWYATTRPLARAALRMVRALPPLRWAGQLARARTVLVAIKPLQRAD